MAYFTLLWKARTIEKYRRSYEREKLNSIRITNTYNPKQTFYQRWRTYNLNTKKRLSQAFLRHYPEGSAVYNFFYYLRTDQTFPNFLIKSVIGFVGGIILTYLCFLFFVFQLSISLIHATIMSSIIGVLLTLGLAFSYRVRCLVFLLIPQFFSRVGRYTLTGYALVLILTGPATNTLKNSEVLSESLACGQEQIKQSIRQINGAMKKPYSSMQDSIQMVIDSIQQVTLKLKQLVVKLNRLVLSIAFSLQTRVDWLFSTADSCNKKLGTPYERCSQAMSESIAECQGTLGPKYSWLCNAAKVTELTCLAVKPLKIFCYDVPSPHWNIFSVITEKLKTFTDRINTMLYLDVSVHHSYAVNGNNSDSSQIASGIITEIRHRADPLLTWLSWSSCVTSLSLLLIIFRAKYYQQMFETRSRFDNRYITKELRELDFTRLKQGKEPLLPLNRREEQKYIKMTSFNLVSSEKVHHTRSVVNMAFTTFKLLIHMVADYSLYWVLMNIRYHGRFQTPLHPGVPNAGAHVTGSGLLSQIFQSLVMAVSKPLAARPHSPVTCLPDPYPPDLQRYAQIGILIVLLWFFAIFEPYGLRLRHVIMGHYRPERAKARAVWLYNHIQITRGGFMKLARRKLHQEYKYLSEEKHTFRRWINCYLPSCLVNLLGLSLIQPHCYLCGVTECGNDCDDTVARCDTPNCPGTFCTKCFADIGQLCTICMSPADYGDNSDVSLEKGSSEESDDNYGSNDDDEDDSPNNPLIPGPSRRDHIQKSNDSKGSVEKEHSMLLQLSNLHNSRRHISPVNENIDQQEEIESYRRKINEAMLLHQKMCTYLYLEYQLCKQNVCFDQKVTRYVCCRYRTLCDDHTNNSINRVNSVKDEVTNRSVKENSNKGIPRNNTKSDIGSKKQCLAVDRLSRKSNRKYSMPNRRRRKRIQSKINQLKKTLSRVLTAWKKRRARFKKRRKKRNHKFRYKKFEICPYYGKLPEKKRNLSHPSVKPYSYRQNSTMRLIACCTLRYKTIQLLHRLHKNNKQLENFENHEETANKSIKKLKSKIYIEQVGSNHYQSTSNRSYPDNKLSHDNKIDAKTAQTEGIKICDYCSDFVKNTKSFIPKTQALKFFKRKEVRHLNKITNLDIISENNTESLRYNNEKTGIDKIGSFRSKYDWIKRKRGIQKNESGTKDQENSLEVIFEDRHRINEERKYNIISEKSRTEISRSYSLKSLSLEDKKMSKSNIAFKSDMSLVSLEYGLPRSMDYLSSLGVDYEVLSSPFTEASDQRETLQSKENSDNLKIKNNGIKPEETYKKINRQRKINIKRSNCNSNKNNTEIASVKEGKRNKNLNKSVFTNNTNIEASEGVLKGNKESCKEDRKEILDFLSQTHKHKKGRSIENNHGKNIQEKLNNTELAAKIRKQKNKPNKEDKTKEPIQNKEKEKNSKKDHTKSVNGNTSIIDKSNEANTKTSIQSKIDTLNIFKKRKNTNPFSMIASCCFARKNKKKLKYKFEEQIRAETLVSACPDLKAKYTRSHHSVQNQKENKIEAQYDYEAFTKGINELAVKKEYQYALQCHKCNSDFGIRQNFDSRTKRNGTHSCDVTSNNTDNNSLYKREARYNVVVTSTNTSSPTRSSGCGLQSNSSSTTCPRGKDVTCLTSTSNTSLETYYSVPSKTSTVGDTATSSLIYDVEYTGVAYKDRSTTKKDRNEDNKLKKYRSIHTDYRLTDDVGTETSDWTPILERKEAMPLRKNNCERPKKKNVGVTKSTRTVTFKSDAQIIPSWSSSDVLSGTQYLSRSTKYYNELYGPKTVLLKTDKGIQKPTLRKCLEK